MIQQFISKLSDQEKKILYITAGFVLLAILDRVFFGPVMVNLKELDADIRQQENIIKRDLRFLSYKDRILKENETYSVFFPQKEQTEEEIIADFLKRIEVFATEAGINLIKVSPTESQSKKGYVEYYANLDCDGPLDKVVSFIYAVDASADLLKVVKFTMSPQRASAAAVTANMVVKKMIIDAKSIEEAIKKFENPEVAAMEDGASGQAGTDSDQKDGKETTTQSGDNVEWNPADAEPPKNQEDQSERYQMKGIKDDAKKKKPPEEEPVDEVKPTPWELLMQKIGK